jgi:hypothetical protein
MKREISIIIFILLLSLLSSCVNQDNLPDDQIPDES